MGRYQADGWKAGLLACAAMLALGGCATVPGAGLATGAPITPQEAQQGSQYHPQFLAEFGGAMAGPQATYIEQVGDNIAVQSGLAASRDAFQVTTLNSSVNNAFAIPGGYIYITRQLVALMNNEAELAAVLGHEVGHVSARHTARRQQQAQKNQLLGLLGAVVSGAVLGDSQLGNSVSQSILQGSQLLTLSYSRGQELEADQLGIGYLKTAGYDPHAMATLLQSLAAQDALDAQLQGRGDATIPQWASTHPDPASRVQNALAIAGNVQGITNRDTFLTRIDGLLYGDDPTQGVVEGNNFIHPQLRLSFTAPQGFYMINGADAVSITGDVGQGQMAGGQLSGGDLDAYVRSVFQKLGGQQTALAPQQIQRTTVNGLPAAYGTARASNSQGQIDVTVFAYDFGGNKAYHFATITPAGGAGVFNAMFGSMRRISTAEASAVVARRVDVVTAARNDTVQTLSRRMAYDSAQEARFRVLNGLRSGDQVVPGQKYKIVIRAN